MNYCTGCGHQIHPTAPACPQCGAPQSSALGTATSGKSKGTAGLLALFLGGLGFHKFYTGAWGWGFIYLALCWTFVPGIVALVEGIRYLTLSDIEFQRKAAQSNGAFSFLW